MKKGIRRESELSERSKLVATCSLQRFCFETFTCKKKRLALASTWVPGCLSRLRYVARKPRCDDPFGYATDRVRACEMPLTQINEQIRATNWCRLRSVYEHTSLSSPYTIQPYSRIARNTCCGKSVCTHRQGAILISHGYVLYEVDHPQKEIGPSRASRNLSLLYDRIGYSSVEGFF